MIIYSSLSNLPDIIAPDSICYYSEITGLWFSKTTTDLVPYFDSIAGNSTVCPVSIIKSLTAPDLYAAHGVVASFAALLKKLLAMPVA